MRKSDPAAGIECEMVLVFIRSSSDEWIYFSGFIPHAPLAGDFRDRPPKNNSPEFPVVDVAQRLAQQRPGLSATCSTTIDHNIGARREKNLLPGLWTDLNRRLGLGCLVHHLDRYPVCTRLRRRKAAFLRRF